MDFFTETSPMKHLGSRKEFTKWLYDIHNLVNNKLGVPSCETPTFEEVEERYQSFRAACKPLSEKQKQDNATKGCISPEDGKPKRCVIKVVEYEKTPETTTPIQTFPKSDDYFVISKKYIYLAAFFLLVKVIIFLFIIFYYRSKIMKILK